MTFTITESNVVTVRQGNPNFMLTDGMITYPRAMLHVLPECPQDVKSKIMWAVNNGYLKCVSHIYKHEETFNALADKA